MKKIVAILFLPLLPLAYLIDLFFGDVVTGIPISVKEKLLEHKKAWIEMWKGQDKS